jgi:RNA polymerase sigma-70 factor (TIGR02960 family)
MMRRSTRTRSVVWVRLTGMTLAAAQAGDEQAFSELVAGHRTELTRHCYRMLGSLDDADEAVQEALLAAWRGLAGFEGRSSVRTWLYRIATRICLRMAERRPRRLLSFDHFPASDPRADLGQPITEPVFLDPWPGGVDDPATTAERRETIELAYVAALQHLPANQRAVLILRDVLDFSAVETAALLDTSVASVTSALQRARASTDARLPTASQQQERVVGEQRGLVDAFVAAFQAADVERMIALLTADVRFTMPPLPAWFDGRDAVATFYAERVFALRWRQVRVADVNGQPAVLGYSEQDGELRPGALQVLSFRNGRISWVASFLDPALWPRLEIVPRHR